MTVHNPKTGLRVDRSPDSPARVSAIVLIVWAVTMLTFAAVTQPERNGLTTPAELSSTF